MRPVGILSTAVLLVIGLLVAGWLLIDRVEFGTPPKPIDPVNETGDGEAATPGNPADDPPTPKAVPGKGAPDAASPGLPLAGQVVDQDGQPLAGAKIRARPLGDGSRPDPVRSGADGRFRFDGLTDARYSVWVTARFHTDASVPARAGTTDIALVLESAGELRVLLGEAEAPDGEFPPSRVTVIDAEGNVEDWEDNEDHRGPEFTFKGIPPGVYRVQAVVIGEGGGENAGVVVRTGETTTVRLPIEEGTVLMGRVVTAEGGAPVPGAFVVATEGTEPSWGIRLTSGERFAWMNGGTWTRAEDDGRFRIVGLTPGRWTVAAAAPGFEPVAETLSLPRAEVVLRLGVGGSLVVALLDRKGLPVPDAHVTVYFPNGGHHSSETDDRGHARFSSLPPGEVSVGVQYDRMWAMRADVVVAAGKSTLKVLQLPGGAATLSGRVTRGGRAEGDRRVSVAVFGDGVATTYRTRTGVDGTFRFDHLLAGPARLRVPPTRDPSEIRLVPGSNTFDLELPTAGVRILVVDHQTGRPIASARVTGARYGHADSEGRIELADMEPVEQTLVVLARGYAPTRIRFTPTEEKQEVAARLRRGAVLSLTIVDPSGEEIPSPHILVKDTGGWQVGGWAADDEAPVFRLSPGTYEIEIEHPDFVTRVERVEFGDTDETRAVTLHPR